MPRLDLRSLGHNGVVLALAAAFLFGASTPFAKMLVGGISPVLLAGILYLGSGAGLGLVALFRRAGHEAKLTRKELPALGVAVLFGGVLGPMLLMIGLATTPASMVARQDVPMTSIIHRVNMIVPQSENAKGAEGSE